jgi:hypothetical protein
LLSALSYSVTYATTRKKKISNKIVVDGKTMMYWNVYINECNPQNKMSYILASLPFETFEGVSLVICENHFI